MLLRAGSFVFPPLLKHRTSESRLGIDEWKYSIDDKLYTGGHPSRDQDIRCSSISIEHCPFVARPIESADTFPLTNRMYWMYGPVRVGLALSID